MASRNDWFSKHKAIEMIIATKNISARVRVTRARDRAREREREREQLCPTSTQCSLFA